MKIQHVILFRNAVRHVICATAIMTAIPELCSPSIAADGLRGLPFDNCSSEGCSTECGEAFLTGPVQRPIYQPSKPPVDDCTTPFIQPSPDLSANLQGSTNVPNNTSAMMQQPAAASVFSGGVEGTLAAQSHAPGYINWAVPRTHFRLRVDSGFNNERPDRAEFFYAQCGCGGGPGPGAPGPQPTVNGSINYQELRGYLEIASGSRFSVFGEVPVRFLQTSPSAGLGLDDTGDAGGISDLEAGFKYALIRDADSVFTFQFKTYIPTGNASQGLGTDHVSLEPGFLAQRRINSRLDVFGEILDWIPVDGSTQGGRNFAGNVLRYGVGAAYTVADTQQLRFSPIVECVGWSVLDGQVLNTSTGDFEDAATTIVNLKVGVRTMFKSNGSTLYLGYGHALTGQSWYEDMARIEYTIFL